MDSADLERFLSHPAASVDVATLPLHWRRSILYIACERPYGLVEGPWLAGIVRGAWGHQLYARQHQAGGVSAYEVFFGGAAAGNNAPAKPKPFAIAVDPHGDQLDIRLTLFGAADFWRDDAFNGLIDALGGGMALRPEGNSLYAPWHVRDVRWARHEQLETRQFQKYVRMTFETPVKLGARHALGSHIPDLFPALARRLHGLAAWQGLALDIDWSACRAMAEEMAFTQDLSGETWVRFSGAQGRRMIPMIGLRGHIDFERPPLLAETMLTLGETTHVGGGTALGMGRYRLS